MNYHIIAKGESLWSIAQMHNCSLAEILAANPQITNPNNISLGEKIYLPEGCDACPPATTPQPTAPQPIAPQPTAPPTGWESPNKPYFPMPPAPQAPQDNQSINDMSAEERDEYCSELANLPRPLIYVVRKNDNIYQLAKCFNISMKELLKVNPHIQNPDMVYPGDKIFVPRAHANHNLGSFTGDCTGRFCPTCGSKLN